MLHRPAFVAFALHNAEPASPLPTLPSCRPYTPTSEIHQRGHVDFVIKLYDDGQMSQVLVRPRFDPPPPGTVAAAVCWFELLCGSLDGI